MVSLLINKSIQKPADKLTFNTETGFSKFHFYQNPSHFNNLKKWHIDN